MDRKKTWLEMGTQTDKTPFHETEVQTEISGAVTGVTSAAGSKSHDPHNDSGVDNEDIDQEAYDLMVKGYTFINLFSCKNSILTLSQTSNFRLFQVER